MTQFEEEVIAFVGELSGCVLVDDGPMGSTMVRSPEIPDLLLLPTQGGTVDARLPFSEDPSVVIWEDMWRNKNALMQSRLLSMFGKTTRVHARVCTVEAITKPQLLDFLDQHHLHPPIPSKTKLALMHEGRIMAVASFSKPCPYERDGRTWKSVELIRFCNASGTTVVGGMSKLIKHYIRTFEPEDIMSYADTEWSSGASYRRLSFKEIGATDAQEFWVEPQTLRRFYTFQHADLLQAADLREFSPEVLLRQGWTRIYNRGSLKFVLEVA